MSDAPKENAKDIDISLVMDKIVEDTIGHISVDNPTTTEKIQKKNKENIKSIDEVKKETTLPRKKKVASDEAIEIKNSVKKSVKPKKEVELFFPVQQNMSKANSPSTKQTKQQPKQNKAQQSKTNKSQENKPQVNKSQASKSQVNKSQVDKPQTNKSQENKPQVNKLQASKSQENKSQVNKQQTSKSQENKPQVNKQQANKSQANKPQASKPQANKQQTNKQQTNRPQAHQTQKLRPTQVEKPQTQPVQSVDVPKKKKHTVRNVLLSLLGMVLLGAAGVYCYFAYYYHDKFMPGTYINQIDAHDLNAVQLEEYIRRRVEDYAIEVEFRDGEKGIITGEAIGYEFVSDGSVAKVLEEQNSLKWIEGYFKEYRHQVSESITFDNDKLQEEYRALPQTRRDNQEGPKDAYVFYQNRNWEIIPEIEGTTIDTNILYQAISDAIHASERECSVEEVEAYLSPKVRQDDSKLRLEMRELNDLVGASVTYKLPQGDEVLDGNMLRLWIQRDSNGRYTKDEEIFAAHIESYVERIADETDTMGKPKLFKTTSGEEVEVEGGDYGWKIDRYTEKEKLKEELANNATVTREPVYSTREWSTENNGFGHTYIEVDLTKQHMYVYSEGRLLLDSEIVSGRMTRRRWTPPGVFTLTYKQRNKVLRGPLQPDGSYEWESPVSYWMPFNRNIGFHDANWQSAFGGERYLTRGSHGCINMPYKKAEALYDIINKDFLIVCFYSEEYTVR